MTVRELQAFLVEALAAAATGADENRLTIEELRRSLNEFFEALEERYQRSPAARAKSHWELVMVDSDPEQRAPFIAVCAQGDQVEWVAGNGPPDEVRAFADDELQGPMSQARAGLEERFTLVTPAISVPRQTFIAWSGYDPV